MTDRSNVLPSALVLFSGGQDSATCLAWALARYGRVETVGFDYGQRHRVELQARQTMRRHYAAQPIWRDRLGPDHKLTVPTFTEIGDTAMTADLPIEQDARGLPTTFVPGRNIVFLSFATALAVKRGLTVLVAGMCGTDAAGYPDCRADTIEAMAKVISLGIDPDIKVETPLMALTKAQTWALADEIGGAPLTDFILEESHTCYLGERGQRHEWGYGCSTCPACIERARGYREWRAG